MIILIDENDVVITKGKTVEERPNGHLIGGCIYPMGTVVEIPDQPVTPQKHMYVNGQIIPNPDYVKPYDGNDIEAIKGQLADAEQAILELSTIIGGMYNV